MGACTLSVVSRGIDMLEPGKDSVRVCVSDHDILLVVQLVSALRLGSSTARETPPALPSAFCPMREERHPAGDARAEAV